MGDDYVECGFTWSLLVSHICNVLPTIPKLTELGVIMHREYTPHNNTNKDIPHRLLDILQSPSY